MEKIRPQPVDPKVCGQEDYLAWVLCHSRTEVTEASGRVGDAVPCTRTRSRVFSQTSQKSRVGF